MIEDILQAVPHNPHYLSRYIRLIKIWQKQDVLGYYERHHICPVSMFSKYKDGRKHEWNIVRLTARQHFIAHWLLWKAYNNRKMAFAFHMICYSKHNYSGRIFEAAKLAASTIGIAKSAETRAKMSAAKKGMKHSEEAKARMSDAQKNRSTETKIKIGLAHRGKTISPEMRAKQSAKLRGEKNPRAMSWGIEWEDGSVEQISSLKTWCKDHNFSYSTIYARFRSNDLVFRNGFRVIPNKIEEKKLIKKSVNKKQPPASKHRKHSVVMRGANNHHSLKIEIEWADGRREHIDSLRPWCIEREFVYNTVYGYYRKNDGIFRNGFKFI